MTDDPSAPFDRTLVPAGLLDVDLDALAAEYGTPLFVYDEDHLRGPVPGVRDALRRGERRVRRQGVPVPRDGAARRGGGPQARRRDRRRAARRAARAGFPAERLVFHGNNKSDAEIEAARDAGVGRSRRRLVRRARTARADRVPRCRCFVRVTPGVEAHTHEYIETGTDRSKFGFSVSKGDALAAVRRVVESPGLDVRGHPLPHRVAGVPARLVCEGRGGRGRVRRRVRTGHRRGRSRCSTSAVDSARGTSTIRPRDGRRRVRAGVARRGRRSHRGGRARPRDRRRRRDHRLPGRHDQGDPGRRDVRGGRRRHERQPAPGAVRRAATRRTSRPGSRSRARCVASIAGKHCEQGDVIVTDARLPPSVAVGDLLVTPVTGAYGYSMASNYNKVPRPAVVFVRSGEASSRDPARDSR